VGSRELAVAIHFWANTLGKCAFLGALHRNDLLRSLPRRVLMAAKDSDPNKGVMR
jgi:hypothetical protein